MKKVLSIALALTLVLCLAISASAAVELYMDADFANGAATDKTGNATLTWVNGGYSKIETTEVTHEGKTYNVPAFVIKDCPVAKTSTDYIMGEFKLFSNVDEYYAVFAEGFTAEVFFQETSGNKDKNPYNSVPFGGCNAAGWAFVLNSTSVDNAYNGGVRFIASTGTKASHSYLAVKNDEPVYEQLTHVVGTYTYDAGGDMSFAVLYINGVEVWSEAKTGAFYTLDVGLYKYFGIGTNYLTSAAGVPLSGNAAQCTSVTVVDAKFYKGAADADEVEKMYNDAVAALASAPAVTPTTAPTTTPTQAPTTAPTQAPTTAPTTTPSTPSTGDTGVVAFLAIMAIISMAAVMVVVKKEH